MRHHAHRRARVSPDSLWRMVAAHARFNLAPGVLMMGIPTGEPVSQRTRGELASLGVHCGAAELAFLRGGQAHFLAFIENEPSPDQARFAAAVVAAGGQFAHASTFQQALAALRRWGVVFDPVDVKTGRAA